MIALAQGALHDALIEAETGLLLVEHPHFIVPQLLAVAIIVQIERGELEVAAEHAAAGEAGAARGGTRLWRRVPGRPGAVADSAGRGRAWRARSCSGAASACRHSACAGRTTGRRTRRPRSPRWATPRPRHAWRASSSGSIAVSALPARSAGRCARPRWRPAPTGGLSCCRKPSRCSRRARARLELAYALADLGAELCRCRRRREGRDAQRRAIELADQCGAIVLGRAGADGPAERTRTPRAGAADRPERADRRGVANLPPSCRRAHQS